MTTLSSKRMGLIARMDNSGLGFQTRELAKLLKPSKVILIDSTPFNGREQHPEWYADYNTVTNMGHIENPKLKDYLKDIDVLISCEIFYSELLPKLAKRMGVKTILQPNAELNPHILNRRLNLPDVFFLPSPWLEGETRDIGIPTYIVKPPIVEPRKYLDIPKEPGTLRVLHFGGRRAAADRNGTEIVRQLTHIPGVYIDIHDQGANEVADQRELYEQGHHVILIPRRYGGLCLPMLESLSYGLPVIMPNIEPNRTELPSEWLVNVRKGRSIKTKHRVETYDALPDSIIHTLETFRDMSQEVYNQERNKAKELYQAHQKQLANWHTYIKEVL